MFVKPYIKIHKINVQRSKNNEIVITNHENVKMLENQQLIKIYIPLFLLHIPLLFFIVISSYNKNMSNLDKGNRYP